MATVFKCTVDGVELFELTDVQERCADAAVHDIRNGMSQITDEEPAIDAADMRLFARKARSYRLSFTAERGHGSVAAAGAFANDHPEAMPAGVGAATVIIGSSTNTYAQGSVRSCECEVRGNRTFTRYEVVLSKP